MDPFEISGDDIAALRDDDLRDLIGKLCEADFRRASLPTSCIHYGGNQDAADGGIDVMVRSYLPLPADSFVKNKNSGFQVKKHKMPASKIPAEIRPKNVIRESILDLIQSQGAYIIVSSGDSLSETAYKNRLRTIRKQCEEHDLNHDLNVDFFDRNRIATWLRNHPSLFLWVRKRIGKVIQGWQSYDNWTGALDGNAGDYISDDFARLYDSENLSKDPMPALEAIACLRQELSKPQASLRLVGLSGTGKTRLAQALFDDTIGNHALNPHSVFYADMGASPDPDPVRFAERMVQFGAPGTIVIDNCGKDLHRKLMSVCTQSESRLSLMTIEYDVRDDLPENTRVFRLQEASENVISQLVLRRFPKMAQPNASRIASFANGNARLAIALAQTLRGSDNLSSFRDTELFDRLFWQGDSDRDDALLRTAEVCSLLYSFDVGGEQSNSEVALLAALAEQSPGTLLRNVARLETRGLAQARSNWRAILPHALANRLVISALDSSRQAALAEAIQISSERVQRSFARRLRFLHESKSAQSIVRGWLGPNGWLSDLNRAGDIQALEVLELIAPVCPEATLQFLNRATSNEPASPCAAKCQNPHRSRIAQLVKRLAYDRSTFRQCINIFIHMIDADVLSTHNSEIKRYLKSLFQVRLSCTHATLQDRLDAISQLFSSKDTPHRIMAMECLDAALTTYHWSLVIDPNFGARTRDYGYHPTGDEAEKWFSTFLLKYVDLARESSEIGREARNRIADKLRVLWLNVKAYDAIEHAVIAILETGPWFEGWIELNRTLALDKDQLSTESAHQLRQLRSKLAPNSLTERVHAYVLTSNKYDWNLVDDDGENFAGENERLSEAHRQASKKIEELGRCLIQNCEELRAILPRIIVTGNNRVFDLGKWLCVYSDDKRSLWNQLTEQYQSKSPADRQLAFLVGFIEGCSEVDKTLCQDLLDEILNDSTLQSAFFWFQDVAGLDANGKTRVARAFSVDGVNVQYFQRFGNGRRHEQFSDDEFARLIESLLGRVDGGRVAVDVLGMRFLDRTEPSLHSTQLLQAGRKILTAFDFERVQRTDNDHPDWDLSVIAKTCLSEYGAALDAKSVCERLRQAWLARNILTDRFDKLIESLIDVQPHIFLDVFLLSDRSEIFINDWSPKYDLDFSPNPFNFIKDSPLIEWCDTDPETRYPLVLPALPFINDQPNEEGEYLRSVTVKLLERSDIRPAVLNAIEDNLCPRSWSGSRADILESRIPAVECIGNRFPELRDWSSRVASELKTKAAAEKANEDQRSREKFVSFE